MVRGKKLGEHVMGGVSSIRYKGKVKARSGSYTTAVRGIRYKAALILGAA